MTDEPQTPRTGLDELLARRALTEDPARADKVERRHAAGGRTARENVADLVDEGSFVEYGRFATAAQEQRKSVDELIRTTPGDGLVGGTATVNRALFGDRAACAVMSYDYLVMAGTQGMRGHHKSDRLIGLVERLRLPAVFFAEGGGGGGRVTPTTPWCPRSTWSRSRSGRGCPAWCRGSPWSPAGASQAMRSSPGALT